MDSEKRWFLTAGMSSIWCNVLHRAGEVFLSAICHLQQSPLSLTSDPSFPLTGADNLFVAETLIDCLGEKMHWEWMQCFIDRLAVAFLPVKCFHFWWMIVKRAMLWSQVKAFWCLCLFALISAAPYAKLCYKGKFCTSWGGVQGSGWHKPRTLQGTKAKQAGPRQGMSPGTVTGTVPGSVSLAPEV